MVESITPAEVKRAHRDNTWPYVGLTDYNDDVVWFRCHHKPTLLLAVNRDLPLAGEIVRAMFRARTLLESFPHMFPTHIEVIQRDDCVYLKECCVHDLLVRQLLRLDLLTRALLLVQDLTYANTLSLARVCLWTWEMGVFFRADGRPELKLLRVDGIRMASDRSVRAIVCQMWAFRAESDDYFEQALAHLLAWARVHRAPPPHQHVLIPPDAIGTLTYLLREILASSACRGASRLRALGEWHHPMTLLRLLKQRLLRPR